MFLQRVVFVQSDLLSHLHLGTYLLLASEQKLSVRFGSQESSVGIAIHQVENMILERGARRARCAEPRRSTNLSFIECVPAGKVSHVVLRHVHDPLIDVDRIVSTCRRTFAGDGGEGVRVSLSYLAKETRCRFRVLD